MSVTPIPEGYRSVTPYLVVRGAGAAIDFYRRAFGAEEILRMPMGERIGHAEIRIGDSVVMLNDPAPEMGSNPTTSSMYLYVENVDDVVAQALSAGAKLTRPVQDQFYGDRLGTVTDPYGHVWHVSTHKEDLSPEELQKRAAAAQQPKKS